MFVFLVIIISFLGLFRFSTRNYTYWKKKKVTYVKPIPFFGSTVRRFFATITTSDLLLEWYKKYTNERYVGYYEGSRISLLLRDPELIKCVILTDFQDFYSRGFSSHKDVTEPLMKNLFSVDGDTWKLLRKRLTRAFTSSKLKAMFPLVVEKAKKLQETIATTVKAGGEVDIKDLMARYTTDFIAACGFGIDTDAFDTESSKFRQIGDRIFAVTMRDAVVSTLKFIAPEMFKYLYVFSSDLEKNMVSIVTGVMKQRNYKPSNRNDFIDLLIEMKQMGKIVGESIEKFNEDGSPMVVELEIDDKLMAAQVFSFFGAGFETSSSTSSFTLHQLAYHPEEQKKCQNEIDEVLCKFGNELSYDAVLEMKYLDMCFRESMRLMPALGSLMRLCTKKYTFPGTDLTIDEGVAVSISLQALQNDEKYFEEPEEFKPERFSSENRKFKDIYMPFGGGPRACIGERLGVMQSLAGLAALLSEFTVEPCKSSVRFPTVDPKSQIVQVIKGGLPLRIVKREKY